MSLKATRSSAVQAEQKELSTEETESLYGQLVLVRGRGVQKKLAACLFSLSWSTRLNRQWSTASKQ